MNIGHPEAMRKETPDGLRYIDTQNQKLKEALQSYGIQLELLDSFIEELEANRHNLAGQLRDRRRYALWAFNNNRKFQELGLEAWRPYIEVIISQKHLYDIGEEIIPLAMVGKKFRNGRKPETYGPVRKAAAQVLKENNTLKPRHIWEKLSKSPPKGWSFREAPKPVGKYVEGPRYKNGQYRNMCYGRFCQVCKEEKNKLIG